MPSVEGHPVYNVDEPCHLAEEAEPLVHYSWVVEECILAAYDRKSVTCPNHGDISLAQVAPDTVSHKTLKLEQSKHLTSVTCILNMDRKDMYRTLWGDLSLEIWWRKISSKKYRIFVNIMFCRVQSEYGTQCFIVIWHGNYIQCFFVVLAV